MRGLVLIGLLALAGCSGDGSPAPPSYGSSDGAEIARLVEDFNEARSDLAKFRALFSGTTPPNHTKYDRKMFDLVGNPEVSGDTATAEIAIRDDASNASLGKTRWTFVKDNGQWKVKDAPLP
jgi:hypothetical protein